MRERVPFKVAEALETTAVGGTNHPFENLRDRLTLTEYILFHIKSVILFISIT